MGSEISQVVVSHFLDFGVQKMSEYDVSDEWYALMEIDFKEISQVWKKYLWPNRKSDIRPVSSLTHEFKTHMDLYRMARPVFYAIQQQGKIIAVNSGYQSAKDYYRSRGLWVDPGFRRMGLGSQLLRAIELEAKKAKCKYLWSLPRISAIEVYKKSGFELREPAPESLMEYGPNFLAVKPL